MELRLHKILTKARATKASLDPNTRFKYLAWPKRRRSDSDISKSTGNMMEIVHAYYNTHLEANDALSSDEAVLKRESLRFEPRILQIMKW